MFSLIRKKFVFFLLPLAFLICLVFPLSLFGTDVNNADEFDDEFSEGEEIAIVKTSSDTKQAQSNFKISGSLSNRIFYNYAHKELKLPLSSPLINKSNDFRGFSSFRNSLNIDLEYKFSPKSKVKSNIQAFYESIYEIKKDEYKTVPKTYQKQAQINEIYYTQNFDNVLDISLGRQIVVWGKSDGINIVDKLNTIDSKEAGLVDIKDLKLGRGMLRIEKTNTNSNSKYEAILLFENRYSKLPEYGSDFASLNEKKAKKINVDEPNNALQNIGVAFSLSKNLQGKDVSLYYAHQYTDNKIYKEHMLGFAYSMVVDNFLLKSEGVYFAQECNLFKCDKADKQLSKKEQDKKNTQGLQTRSYGMIGISYNGIKDGSLLFEFANKNDIAQYFIKFNQSYINQVLSFNLAYGGYRLVLSENAFLRGSLDYSISDNLKISFGAIDYFGGEIPQFESIKNNDRFFLITSYSF
jgi:hypothetical protein